MKTDAPSLLYESFPMSVVPPAIRSTFQCSFHFAMSFRITYSHVIRLLDPKICHIVICVIGLVIPSSFSWPYVGPVLSNVCYRYNYGALIATYEGSVTQGAYEI